MNKNFFVRNENSLVIGEAIFLLEKFPEIDTGYHPHPGIIYLENLEDEIIYEDIISAISEEKLEKELLKLENLKFIDIFKQMKKSKIKNFILSKRVRIIENTDNIFLFLGSPYINILENDCTITWKISYKIENWNLKLTISEFINLLIKKFKNAERISYSFGADAENDGITMQTDRMKNINIEYLFDELRDKKIEEVENDIKNEIINIFLEIQNKVTEMKLLIEDLDYKFIVKQYLNGFPEFIRKATGKIIYFEIETAIDGLVIKIDKNEDFEKYRENLALYLSFKENDIPNLDALRQLGLNGEQLSAVILFLTTQIVAYQRQYERLVENNKLLEGKNEELSKTVQILDRLFSKNIECSQNNQKIEVTNKNYLENKNSVDINVQVTQNIEKLQENMYDLEKLLIPMLNHNSKEELKEIVNELLNIRTEDELRKKTGILLKIKYFLKSVPQAIATATTATTAIRESLDKFPIIQENILKIIEILSKYI